MKVTLINPKLIINKKDKFTTGIVYMPIGLAYVNAFLKKNNIETSVIDLFSNGINKITSKKKFLEIGDDIENYIKNFDSKTLFFVYANQIINHDYILHIIKLIKKNFNNNYLGVIQNSQAVTAYSLEKVKKIFFDNNVDILLISNPERAIFEIVNKIKKKENLENINNTITPLKKSYQKNFKENLDKIFFPDWEGFKIENYWKLGHAHGPLSSKKYLPILTSRGCPYPCKFCVVPQTSSRIWIGRSPKNIVDEIVFFQDKYQIEEFHLEDLNPTVNEGRTIKFCNELIKRNIKIKWKIVSGTKVESIKKLSTLKLMAKSGCKYISISPESGSTKVMKMIDKPFDIDHAKLLIKQMNMLGIKSQACFVLGFPGENDHDRSLTKKMIIDLTKSGLDEVALFIITPIPGSKIFNEIKGYNSLTELNFSPNWRTDYKHLNTIRIKFYLIFIFIKIIFYPNKILKQIYNFFTKKFETKMEMVPYKFIKIMILQFKT